ncbi:hypothetical protein ACMDCR_20000 [Labrys okinawensis]|uniref:hypothetical protein n=1 Tax=Labrys okinawensis TaxID=346911 RepID=UPI0039BCDA78
MIFVWPVLMAAILGVFCGLWAPLLLFILLIFGVALGSVVSMSIAGFGIGWLLLELFAVLTALEFGYLIGLFLRIERAEPTVSGRQRPVRPVPEATQLLVQDRTA